MYRINMDSLRSGIKDREWETYAYYMRIHSGDGIDENDARLCRRVDEHRIKYEKRRRQFIVFLSVRTYTQLYPSSRSQHSWAAVCSSSLICMCFVRDSLTQLTEADNTRQYVFDWLCFTRAYYFPVYIVRNSSR